MDAATAESPEGRSSTASDALDAAPGLARIAAGAWLRTAEWTAGTALRTTRRPAGVAVWFSRDKLSDPAPYQVLEAHPDVIALRATGRARIVRRSIHLLTEN